jgi:SAM-dependent methyltransferase
VTAAPVANETARRSGSSDLIQSFELWRRPRRGDSSVVTRCSGPTLDVGCGPGRMAHAVAAAGVPVLGIDVSRRAVAEARARGAAALRRDVFGELPAAGRWHHVLLLDGNIGIGGDPITLLTRCRQFIRDGGTILVEVEQPEVAVEHTTLRLVIDGHITKPVPWARVGVSAVRHIAAAAALDILDVWTSHGRAFAALRRRGEGGPHNPDQRAATAVIR